MDSLTETVEIHRSGVSPSQVAYTFRIGARPLQAGERGASTWPRVTLADGCEAVVVHVKAYEGGRDMWAYPPAVEWELHPIITPTSNGRPRAVSRVQHILNAAPLNWKGRGRHTLEETDWPYWREMTDKAISFKVSGYTWDQISGNMEIAAGTIRRWVGRRRKGLRK